MPNQDSTKLDREFWSSMSHQMGPGILEGGNLYPLLAHAQDRGCLVKWKSMTLSGKGSSRSMELSRD